MTRPHRRRALLASALLPYLGRRAAAQQDGPTLLVPGPENGAAARWAARLLKGIGRASPPFSALQPAVVGGPDGVTAANRFATAEVGDGRFLLVLTGPAMLASLSGSERARFRPGGWLPLCASWGSAVVAGRGAMPATEGVRTALRMVAPAPDAAEAAALLAVESLGLPTRPVSVPPAAAGAAFREGAIDALLLAGPDVAAQAAFLGATPWFGFGTRRGSAVPDHAALVAAPGPLHRAVEAAAGAARLRGALLLPALTSADVVATWRQAALRWRDAELADGVEDRGEPLAGADAAAALSTLSPPPDAVLAWRDWLRRRLNWQPG